MTIYTYHVQIGLTAAVGAGLPIGEMLLGYIHVPIPSLALYYFFPSLQYALYKNTYNHMVSMLPHDLDTQGPFVHLACIIANLMNKIITTVNTVFSVSESASVSRK